MFFEVSENKITLIKKLKTKLQYPWIKSNDGW